MTTNFGLLFLGLITGGFSASLIVYILVSKKAARFEARAGSAEAVNDELRQQIDQRAQELAGIKDELQNESRTRAAIEAKYQEAEKNLKTMEKDLIDKFSTISLDALSKNSAEFLKLAEEKLKSQTIEGVKELEGKKGLIDKSIMEIDRTLTDVKQKIEEVSKGNIKVSTLVENHEKVTSKLKDTTEHLGQALASSKKRGEWGERMAVAEQSILSSHQCSVRQLHL